MCLVQLLLSATVFSSVLFLKIDLFFLLVCRSIPKNVLIIHSTNIRTRIGIMQVVTIITETRSMNPLTFILTVSASPDAPFFIFDQKPSS